MARQALGFPQRPEGHWLLAGDPATRPLTKHGLPGAGKHALSGLAGGPVAPGPISEEVSGDLAPSILLEAPCEPAGESKCPAEGTAGSSPAISFPMGMRTLSGPETNDPHESPRQNEL